MKKSRFDELLESAKEAVAIHKGEKYPDQTYRYESPNVKAIRDSYKFSQAKFAAMLGISKRTLEGWEQGRRQPTGPARRLLEVAARFPDIVYRAIFERKTEAIHNIDGSVTNVTTRIGASSLPFIIQAKMHVGAISNVSRITIVPDESVMDELRALMAEAIGGTDWSRMLQGYKPASSYAIDSEGFVAQRAKEHIHHHEDLFFVPNV